MVFDVRDYKLNNVQRHRRIRNLYYNMHMYYIASNKRKVSMTDMCGFVIAMQM